MTMGPLVYIIKRHPHALLCCGDERRRCCVICQHLWRLLAASMSNTMSRSSPRHTCTHHQLYTMASWQRESCHKIVWRSSSLKILVQKIQNLEPKNPILGNI